MEPSLTLDGLLATIEQLKPVQYYATTDALPPGKCFMVQGDWYWPKTIIFHPTDFEQQRASLSRYCRFVHLREWKPSLEQEARAWDEVFAALARAGAVGDE